MEPKAADGLFAFLSEQSRRPPLFSAYTAEDLWTDPHVAEQMLSFHLDPDQDLASRNHAFIERSIQWLAETFELSSGKRVLDLGCGPGLYANGMAEIGASVTGVDFSKNSLAYARTVAADRGLKVDYHQANYLSIELDELFDLVLLIFGDFCPLGPEQRRRLLDNVRGWLAPGGRFVFDVSSKALFDGVEESASYEAEPEGGFWSPGPHFAFTHRFKYPADMAYLDRYVVVEADRQRELFNWIQCYDRARLEAELDSAGWVVESTFGDVSGGRFDPKNDFFAVVTRPSGGDWAVRG
jgi:SAM-dependent methyltransferase